MTDEAPKRTYAPDREWIAFGLIIAASILGDTHSTCSGASECEEWADGSPMDNVDADERRKRDAYCRGES